MKQGVQSMLKVEHTVRSYSGAPGCMCGCKGTYKDTPRARKMAITQLLRKPGTRLQVFGYSDRDGSAGCIYFDSPTRNRVLYLTQDGVDAVKQHYPNMVQED